MGVLGVSELPLDVRELRPGEGLPDEPSQGTDVSPSRLVHIGPEGEQGDTGTALPGPWMPDVAQVGGGGGAAGTQVLCLLEHPVPPPGPQGRELRALSCPPLIGLQLWVPSPHLQPTVPGRLRMALPSASYPAPGS